MFIKEIEVLNKEYFVCTDEDRSESNDAPIQQFIDAMSQSFSVKGFLAPDFHKGYSLPIGSVIATKDKIVPAWVGYDIGCGMCAFKTDFRKEDVERKKNKIFDEIYEKIPVGFNKNDSEIDYPLDGLTFEGGKIAISKKYKSALGSLGGGNHFIELGYDEKDSVWIIIHSGSRGVGHGIATHYMKLASSNKTELEEQFDKDNKALLKFNPTQYESYKEKYVNRKNTAKPKEGHYNFDISSDNGKRYIQDMNWCLDYALDNRKEMMIRVVRAISNHTIKSFDINFSKMINRNHNHAVEKNGLWIHRKGATHAEDGMLGVIPGNMRDGSFIVEGRGNEDSLCSSSHGAGRLFGRIKARETLNMTDFKNATRNIKGKIDETTLDEAPMAYKDIFKVMELQHELVKVIAHIKPIINIKG